MSDQDAKDMDDVEELEFTELDYIAMDKALGGRLRRLVKAKSKFVFNAQDMAAASGVYCGCSG